MDRPAPQSRLIAALVGGIAVVSLRLQWDMLAFSPGLEPFGARMWVFVSFFTILTNTVVAGHLLAHALG